MVQIGLTDIDAVAVGHLTVVDIEAVRHGRTAFGLDLDHLIADQAEPLEGRDTILHRLGYHDLLLGFVGTGDAAEHTFLAEADGHFLSTRYRHRRAKLAAVEIQSNAIGLLLRR